MVVMFSGGVLLDLRRIFDAWAYYCLEMKYLPDELKEIDEDDDDENDEA